MIPYSTLVLLILFISVALYTDARYSVIPNWLNLAGAAAGLVNALILQGAAGVLHALLGMAGGFLAVLALYLFKAVEAGDVKVFAAIGAITGTEFVLYAVMHSVVFAALYGLAILLVRRMLVATLMKALKDLVMASAMKDWRFIQNMTSQGKIQIPFMFAVVPGIIATCFYY